MSHAGLRDQILRLEGHIEELAELAEKYRKLIVSQSWPSLPENMVVGNHAVAIGFDPVTMIGAIAVVIGGIVVFGSNTSTLKQATIDIKADETLRAELIGKMDLGAL